MTDLERKCNEYREYKRLAEQAEQMRDSLRDEIIAMMQGAPEVMAGDCYGKAKGVHGGRRYCKLFSARQPDTFDAGRKKNRFKRGVVGLWGEKRFCWWVVIEAV